MKFGAKSIAYFTFFLNLCSINGVYFNIVGVCFLRCGYMADNRNRFAYNFARFGTMTH